ncbi:ABC transporter permease [Kurthia sibirica]|uniref:Protein EcsB n=1 Tax=Kurthia sibirica TaxID=202750 RepID=A0A2U3AJF8_9BACL|nr:ABC transporter permease [Kurthia sibirica]PWI24650.1 protein EcsB [Kurthia sibirica]GEK33482.1 ABC transporter permease [Kurthia sibirica]
MNNLNDVWRKRFNHYISELQKYMKYIFTGHMALVIVFLLGAGGYKYSNWLKEASHDFPAIWVTAVVMGLVLAFSKPVTLIKKPDEVYLLPLETKMSTYFNKALNYSLMSQVAVAGVIYVVMWPMLRQVGELPASGIAIGLAFTILLKWWNVHVEFMFRWALEGRYIWLDRFARAVLSALFIYSLLHHESMIALVLIIILAIYPIVCKKRTLEKPFPYEHFVQLEENRMMGIYRFANYFTDVPAVSGSIKRRRYLDFIVNMIPKTKEKTFDYYLLRSLIRTDDNFFLWLRLTVISALVAAFANIPIIIGIVVTALAFATAIQLKQTLGKSAEFSMSMLYPLKGDARQQAAIRIARYSIIVQAVIVLLAGIGTPYFYIQGIIVLVVGELTLRLSK